MRSRATYATFEETVISLYDAGELTVEHLDYLASIYRVDRADSSGSQYLLTKDNKDLQQVCISLIDPFFVLVPQGSADDNDEYWEMECKKWSEIVEGRWQWR